MSSHDDAACRTAAINEVGFWSAPVQNEDVRRWSNVSEFVTTDTTNAIGLPPAATIGVDLTDAARAVENTLDIFVDRLKYQGHPKKRELLEQARQMKEILLGMMRELQ